MHSLLTCLFTVLAQIETQKIPSEHKKNFFYCEDGLTLQQVVQSSWGVAILGHAQQRTRDGPGNLLQLTLELQKCLPTSVVLLPWVAQLVCVAAIIQHPLCATCIHPTMLSTACCCSTFMIKYKTMTQSCMWSNTVALVPFSCLLIQKCKEVDALSQGIINGYFHTFMNCKHIVSYFKSSISEV